jgi:hypothetical protein
LKGNLSVETLPNAKSNRRDDAEIYLTKP